MVAEFTFLQTCYSDTCYTDTCYTDTCYTDTLAAEFTFLQTCYTDTLAAAFIFGQALHDAKRRFLYFIEKIPKQLEAFLSTSVIKLLKRWAHFTKSINESNNDNVNYKKPIKC